MKEKVFFLWIVSKPALVIVSGVDRPIICFLLILSIWVPGLHLPVPIPVVDRHFAVKRSLNSHNDVKLRKYFRDTKQRNCNLMPSNVERAAVA